MPRMQRTVLLMKKALHNRIGCTALNNHHRYCTHLLHSRVYSIFKEKENTSIIQFFIKKLYDSKFDENSNYQLRHHFMKYNDMFHTCLILGSSSSISWSSLCLLNIPPSQQNHSTYFCFNFGSKNSWAF